MEPVIPMQHGLSKPSWTCIHFVDTEQSRLICRIRLPSEILLLEANVGEAGSVTDLISAVSQAMEFPSYFGNSWDALEKCLRDMAWLPAEGYVLLLHGAGKFWATATKVAGALVESWLPCAEEWATIGVAFHLVFDMGETSNDSH